MSEILVDPDSLTAASEVARRQHGHLQSISDYIAGWCGQFGAFSGVLNLFEGSYREAVTAAVDGMRDSMTVADRMQEAVVTSRQDFLDTDREVYELFKKKFGDLVDFPPYQAPGSGESVPGEPGSTPTGGGTTAGDDEPFGLTKLPPWMQGALDRGTPGADGGDTPGYLEPRDWAKDKLLAGIRDHQVREDYMDLRRQGLSPQDALDQARNDASDHASNHVYDRTEQRAEGAYNDAYDRAIADGQSPEDAERAGQGAASDQRHTDGDDTRRRERVLDDGRTYVDAYHGASDAVDNVNDIIDHTRQLDETLDDLEDYDDYEDSPTDHSAQDWADR